MAATLLGRVQNTTSVARLSPSWKTGRKMTGAPPLAEATISNDLADAGLAKNHPAKPCMNDADRLDSIACQPKATSSAHLHRKQRWDEATDTGSDSNSETFGNDDSLSSCADADVALRIYPSGPRMRHVRFLDEVTDGSVEEVFEILAVEMVEEPTSMCREYGDLLDTISGFDSDEEATSGVDMVRALARML